LCCVIAVLILPLRGTWRIRNCGPTCDSFFYDAAIQPRALVSLQKLSLT
jgi:hypothetical protein